MKSMYKIVLGICLSSLSHSVVAIDAPSGLAAGDPYYVMFISSSNNKKRGNLTVSQYNDWVSAEADAANIGPAIGVTWSAFMNHEDAGGTTTEQTLSLFDANTTAPIYTTAGEKIALNKADLFNGDIITSIRYEADGVTEVASADTVWTGSNSAGLANFPLGNAAEPKATEGLAGQDYLDDRWADDTNPELKTGINRIYAVSRLLLAGAPTAGDIIASRGGASQQQRRNCINRIYAVSRLLLAGAPTAGNDIATVAVNSSVDINVLANDTNAGGSLNVSTVAVQTLPANGAAVVNPANGVITYTPNGDFIGSDSFTYFVQDDLGADSNIATVTITVTVAAAPASSSDGGGAMGWSLLMLFSVLSLLRAKVRK